ncbi:MAG: CoA-binding protein, partial [Gemmatimonadetes bacterium]|nr:CoA-binding protein [Gemmatimonadota bacterium]NIQ54217.1 CoA-binding protein [Gemmatimonadota bacterium]NIU74422.1 CoA-binding protein [Gammaproteobacteria bacterium]NIX46665.1 CoA-binding protein [Gemmatimonadota bacterium]
MTTWRDLLVQDDAGVRTLLAQTRRIAVLGIKPESRRGKAAFYVPAYMQRAGLEVVPVPVYYPEVTEILGEPVYRSLAQVPGPIDLVDVFRRSEDIPPHVPDILA